MQSSTSIKAFMVILIGVPLALYLGVGAATQGFATAIKVIGVAALFFCLLLGRKIWLFAFFLSALGLTLNIPGRPSTSILGQLSIVGFGTLLLLIRRLPVRFKFGELEIWAILFLLCVFQSFARNPVGLNFLGSSQVGGRPYALLALTVCAGFLVSILKVPPKELKQLVWIVIGAGFISFGLMVGGYFVPSVGIFFGAVSINEALDNPQGYGEDIVDPEAAGRIRFLGSFGVHLSRVIGTFRSPISACFRPGWLILVLISFAAAAMSGFRSSIGMVGLNYLFAIAYRDGIRGLLLSAFVGGLGLVLLAFYNLVMPLPANIQRALTVLPGTWQQRYVDDAQRSTDWRTEMWMEALTSERYIDNKWLGDGLGVDIAKLKRAAALKNGEVPGYAGWDPQREAMMLTGNYHSGPVQTIRAIGYFGLVVLVIAQIRLAVHAHRLIKRTKGTEWFTVALWVGIPIIWKPLFFIFVFGTFGGAASALIMGVAVVRLLGKNLPLAADVPKAQKDYVPMATRKNSQPAAIRA